MNRIITPSELCGIVSAPPSKSDAHRALICAALSGVGAKVKNIGTADDTLATLSALRSLGFSLEQEEGNVEVKQYRPVTSPKCDCRESAATLRFLIPLSLVLYGEGTFCGTGRLLSRPMEVYESVFSEKGISFIKTDTEIRVKGQLTSGTYSLAGDISSQFVSGLMFSLPLLSGDSELLFSAPLESKSYVDMTVRTLSAFGISIQETEYGYWIPGSQTYHSTLYEVEGDDSAASTFLLAGALCGNVTVTNLARNSVQGDRKIFDILQQMGGLVQRSQNCITAKKSKLSGGSFDVSDIPDLVPNLAAAACYMEGSTELYHAGRLRYKESDRLRTMTEELTKMGAIVEMGNDYLKIHPSNLTGAELNSHRDHRIAMALALAATVAKQDSMIKDAECVQKSMPNFWTEWKRIGGKIK